MHVQKRKAQIDSSLRELRNIHSFLGTEVPDGFQIPRNYSLSYLNMVCLSVRYVFYFKFVCTILEIIHSFTREPMVDIH